MGCCSEYCGDIINFKTCSKSFKNKTRYANPEDKWAIFKNVHEPIIDREVFEQVQKLIGKTRRRNPKPENWERNMFCDLLLFQGNFNSVDMGALKQLCVPIPTTSEPERIISILDRFDALCNDLTSGLPAEIEARTKQYEYYRDKLLTFKEQ